MRVNSKGKGVYMRDIKNTAALSHGELASPTDHALTARERLQAIHTPEFMAEVIKGFEEIDRGITMTRDELNREIERRQTTRKCPD